jgi:branched-chain amino acid transport system permease protein
MFLIGELVQIIWGRLPVRYAVPQALDFALFTLWDSHYPAYRVFMMIVSVGMLFALYLLLTRTRIGITIQASLTHPDMVGMLGHNVPLIFMMTFAVGTALAGVAGVIGGNLFITEPAMAGMIGPIIFAIIVIGGVGSITGAFVASCLIGLIQTFAVAIDFSLADLMALFGVEFTGAMASITVAQAAPALPFLLLAVILIFRPKGLMGVREA